MTRHAYEFFVFPNTIVMRDKKILLLRRADWAPHHPGCWHVPTGKMEEGETPKQTAIRETFEEVGLMVDPDLGTIVSVKGQSIINPGQIYQDIGFFFVCQIKDEEPVNKEPRLHPEMAWFDVHNLPSPFVPVVKFGIEQYLRGEAYGEFNAL